MILFGKDLDREVVVVAEIGVNHEGDIDAAAEMVRRAARAGADAVKLQGYTPERYVSASDAERLERLRRFQLDRQGHRHLAKIAAEAGIAFFSTPLTEDLVQFLADLSPAIKIASGDATFEPTVRAAAATGKPVILSTGLATVEEIDRTVEWFRDAAGSEDISNRLALMHCVSAYPTPIDQANVRSVAFLKERYGLVTGYSNHVVEPEAVYAAIALGADIVEVHFTDRRAGRDFRDHALSLEEEELRALVESIGRVRASLGIFGKPRQECEAGGLDSMRKGIVAARDIGSGARLSADDLMYARPATEFAASELPSLVGRTLTQSLKLGELIRRDSVV